MFQVCPANEGGAFALKPTIITSVFENVHFFIDYVRAFTDATAKGRHLQRQVCQYGQTHTNGPHLQPYPVHNSNMPDLPAMYRLYHAEL